MCSQNIQSSPRIFCFDAWLVKGRCRGASHYTIQVEVSKCIMAIDH